MFYFIMHIQARKPFLKNDMMMKIMEILRKNSEQSVNRMFIIYMYAITSYFFHPYLIHSQYFWHVSKYHIYIYIYIHGVVHVEMVTSVGNGANKTVCIWLTTNILRKCMNPTILPSAMGKFGGRLGLFNNGVATRLGEGKIRIPTC